MPTVFSAPLSSTKLAMRLNFDSLLLDKMSEGVILLNRRAEILAHNSAAKPWLPQGRAMTGVLKELIDREIRGRIVMPLSVGAWAGKTPDGAHPGDAWLIVNGRHDYALFVVPKGQRPATEEPTAAATQPSRAPQRDQFSLLGDEARAQVKALRILLVPQINQQSPDLEAIATQSAKVDQLLQEISDFALLMQREQPFVEDRMVLSDLISTLLKTRSGTLARSDVEFAFTPGLSQQGPVYGHASWLCYALQALFERLVDSAPPASQVNIETRQMGHFVVITGHVVANLTPDKRLPRRQEDTEGSPGKTQIKHAPNTAIRMLMCRRIVELHNGQLKLEFMPDSAVDDAHEQAVESFTLTLTTSLPAQQRHSDACTQCPINLQTQAYAADLVQLLSLNQPSLSRS